MKLCNRFETGWHNAYSMFKSKYNMLPIEVKKQELMISSNSTFKSLLDNYFDPELLAEKEKCNTYYTLSDVPRDKSSFGIRN